MPTQTQAAVTPPTLYHDGGDHYLELHAMRAPVGGYATWITNTPDGSAYDFAVEWAIQGFEDDYNVRIFALGRSGRHICIEDTPRNRTRYAKLQAAAIAAAEAMWQDMRTEREPDATVSEN